MALEDAALLVFSPAAVGYRTDSDVQAADLDGDGQEDFIFSTPRTSGSDSSVHLYLSSQSGW